MNPWKWLVRAWRWKVEIRPIQNLLFYGVLYGLAVWLPYGGVTGARSLLLVLTTICVAVPVAIFGWAWWQRRKTRRAP